MVAFILVISAVMILSALAIKVFILVRYFKEKEKEAAMAQENSAISPQKDFNEKDIISDDQVNEIISAYKRSESAKKLQEEKAALLKLKDMKILSAEEYNEKMFILEDMYKLGKL